MRPAIISSDQVVIASSKSWYIRGVYLSGLNPKPAVILALLPPFIDPQAALSPLKLFYWRIHLYELCGCFILVGFSAQKFWARAQAARVVSQCQGIDDVDCDDFIVRTVYVKRYFKYMDQRQCKIKHF